MQDSCTIWVCQDCMLHHANGECNSCHTDEGHDREPLGLIDQPMSGREMVTMGMLAEQHSCKSNDEPPHMWECNCEYQDHSTSTCAGCGTTLHGERHAMTLWLD